MRYDKGHVIFLSNGTAVIAGRGNGVDSDGEPDKYGTFVNVFYSAGIFALDFTFLQVFLTGIAFHTFYICPDGDMFRIFCIYFQYTYQDMVADMKALLVIDIQNSYISKYEPGLLRKINDRILEVQNDKCDIIYVKNTKMLRSGPVTDELAEGLLLASDNVFCKTRADAFSSKELVSYLNSQNITEIEIIGVDGNSCINASAKGAIKKGYAVSSNLSCIGVVNPLRFEKTKETLSVREVILKQS